MFHVQSCIYNVSEGTSVPFLDILGECMELLNTQQEEAVQTINGPLQILAGAGSGKTKVIINRIANIIHSGVDASNILALTFTNKAASEMKTRLENLIGDLSNGLWIGTFHSICLRILRMHIDKLGYTKDFIIYDHYDQQVLIKDCMKTLNINDNLMKPVYFSGIISSSKDELISYRQYQNDFAKDIRTKTAAKVYEMYQKKLKANNAIDFDDMIFLTITIFKEYPEILNHFQDKFRYILVDEYQDTNHAQYILISMLAKKYRNICVVGDDDQSIYGWRGADIRNILDFANEYRDLTTIKLEQNYRSTKNILEAANSVIEKNTGRKSKKLWTENKHNDKIQILKSKDDRLEAKNIAKEISKLVDSGKYCYKDVAILYRMNALSRLLEEELINSRIPYTIYGGLKFYDRKEIKDILAYLKLIVNPSDDVALKRIINVPKRSIGLKSIEKIEIQANIKGESLFSALLDYEELDLSTKTKNSIKNFLLTISSLKSMAEIVSIDDLIEKIFENTNYRVELQDDDEIELESRLENIEELKSVAKEFYANAQEKTISEFLASVALSSDIDSYEDNTNLVTLMTLHSSKGLEFPVVFISGMEEGIFPSAKSLMSDVQIEEERRLCYVGMTRAKERLYLSYALGRIYFGKFSAQIASRFIKDVPSEISDGSSKPCESSVQGYSLLDKYKKKKEMVAHVKPQIETSNSELSMGSEVSHPIFGKGKIVAKDHNTYTVVFAGSGIKKIDKTFTKLKLL